MVHEFAMILIGEEAVRQLKFDAILAALGPCEEVLTWLRTTGPLGPDVPDLFKAVTDAVWDRSAPLEDAATAKSYTDLLLVAEEVDSTEDKDGDGEIDVGGAEVRVDRSPEPSHLDPHPNLVPTRRTELDMARL